MSSVVDEAPGQRAREALSRHAWREAYDRYTSVDKQDLTPADLRSFAEAAWLTGRLDDAINLRERAYTGFSTSGEKLNAARVALALSWDHSGRAAFSVSNGWFATAERLLEGEFEHTSGRSTCPPNA